MKLPRLFPLTLIVLSLGLIAGCGDDDGGGGDSSEDPQTILEQTLNNDEMVDSGVLDISFNGEAEGDQGGSADFSISGPFANNGPDELPTLDWDISLSVDGNGQQIDFNGGAIVVDGNAFVNYQDTDYEIDAATLDALESQAGQASGSTDGQQSLSQFGVDPIDWFSNLSNDGTEDVDGTETIHISGDLDVTKVVEDFASIAEQTGQAPEVDQAQLDKVTEAFDEASFDLFTGAEDKQLRKLDGVLSLTPPDGSTDNQDVSKVNLDFSVAVTDIGEEPDVSAPEDAQPIEDLLSELGGLGALGGLGGSGGIPPESDASGSGGEADTGPADDSGASDSAPEDPQAAQDYVECLQDAKSAEDQQKCVDMLQP